MYSPDLIESVLHSADIVAVISSYINVEKRGRSHLAVCPFHDDKNPSLNISQEKQIFKCFSCGAGGNAITFVQRYERISYPEAIRKVAEISGFADPRLIEEAPKIEIDPGKKKLYDCINDLNAFYQYGLSTPEGAVARDYLKTRHIDETQQRKYGIGYSLQNGELTVRFLLGKGHSLKSIEDIGIAFAKIEGTSDSNAGRITFPIFDPHGQVVGFSARRLDSIHEKKYVNSPEGPIFHKGDILYNYHNVSTSAKRDGYCYVLEGFMDVMALEKAGLPNAVALMGTSLTNVHVDLLRKLRCELRLCLDGDTAGQNGMMKMCSLLSKANIPFRFVDYGSDLRDPDDILQEDGPEALKERMGRLIDALDFQLNYYTHTKKLETADEKRKVVAEFLPYIRSLAPGIEQENYIIKLAKSTGYETEAIRTLLLKSPVGEETEEEAIYREARALQDSEHPERPLLKRLRIAERTILYYMTQEPEAVEFFKNYVRDFDTDVYEVVAMSILEYAKEHPGEIKIEGVVALMQAKQSPEFDHASDVVTSLAMEENRDPYSIETLKACLNTIVEEKERIHDSERFESALENGGDAAAALKELLQKKAAKWPTTKKKGGTR